MVPLAAVPEEESGPQGVLITNKDIYIELLAVRKAVDSMSPQAEQLKDHEERIRSVEKWKYALPASIVTSVTAIAVAILETRHG